jgi:hypothetical protein
MAGLSPAEVVSLVVAVVFVWPRRHALAEALQNFRNGGGGPGSPPSPLPSNDARLLLKRLINGRR